MDEPTAGELMRAIQEVKQNQNSFQSRVEGLFSDLSRNYVRSDIYEERSKGHGERLGRAEKSIEQLQDAQKARDEDSKMMKRLIWTSLGSPLLLLLIGLGIKLAGIH